MTLRITKAVSDFGVTPTRVHADEAVAAGAAIQGSLLGAGASETLLLDVTSHDLGLALRADFRHCHSERYDDPHECNQRVHNGPGWSDSGSHSGHAGPFESGRP